MQRTNEVSWSKHIAHRVNGGNSGEVGGTHSPKREAAVLLETIAAIPKPGPASLDLPFCFVKRSQKFLSV